MTDFSFQRFFQATTKAHELFCSQKALNEPQNLKTDMYVRQGDSFLRIDWKNILYVEGMQNYVKLYLKDRTLTIHQTMTSVEETLPSSSFFRIHRSFLVNVSQIDTISGSRLFINGKELPISKQRRDELLSSIVYKNLISK